MTAQNISIFRAVKVQLFIKYGHKKFICLFTGIFFFEMVIIFIFNYTFVQKFMQCIFCIPTCYLVYLQLVYL